MELKYRDYDPSYFGDWKTYLKARCTHNMEMKLKRRPTDKDIRETRNLFSDFGMGDVAIPDIGTYGELVRWRKGVIVDWLDRYDEMGL